MSRNERFKDDNERPTSPGGKSNSGPDHTLGQLMADVLNYRRRLEVLELRMANLETKKQDSSPPESGGSVFPGRRTRLFALVKKTVTYAVVGIAAVISTLRELGYFK